MIRGAASPAITGMDRAISVPSATMITIVSTRPCGSITVSSSGSGAAPPLTHRSAFRTTTKSYWRAERAWRKARRHPNSRRRRLQRFAQQRGVWNFVWWRRLFYFSRWPLRSIFCPSRSPHGTEFSREYTTRLRLIPEALRVAGEFLPAFVTSWWIDSFAAHPITFLVSAVLVAVPIFFGLRLETAIQDRMLDAWRGTRRPPTSLTRFWTSLRFSGRPRGTGRGCV